MKEKRLSMLEINYINNTINGYGNVEELFETASNVVSKLLQTPTILAINSKDVLEKIKVINIADRLLLVVLVSKSGSIKDCIVKVNENLPQDIIENINSVLNNNLKDTPFESLKYVIEEMLKRELSVFSDVMDNIAKTILSEIEKKDDGLKVKNNISEVLKLPEFEDIEKARQFVNLLSTKEILDTTLNSINNKKLAIVIGNESSEIAFNDYSIVSLNLESEENNLLGKIGIIGPKRMDYSKAISTLKMVNKRIKDILNNTKK